MSKGKSLLGLQRQGLNEAVMSKKERITQNKKQKKLSKSAKGVPTPPPGSNPPKE